MAQVLEQVKNPWGAQTNPNWVGALNVQRTDLFTLNVSDAVSYLGLILLRAANGSQGELARGLLNAMPTRFNAMYFASAVDFPEQTTGTAISKRHEMPYNFPASDQALSVVTISWILDSGSDAYRIGRALALLRAWKAVVRAGRGGQDPNELQLDLQTASRSGRGYVPDFRHNMAVYLWRGKNSITEDVFNGAATPENSGFDIAQRWILKNAWLAGFQQPSLSHQGNGQNAIVRSTFYCDAIVEGRLWTPDET